MPIEYLTGEQVISRLLAVLGTCGWSFRILQHDIHLEADEVWVLGELRLLLNADDPVVRQQFGSSKIKRARATGAPLDIGFDLKSAATDCLKKCATLVGVGLYLTHKRRNAQDHRRQLSQTRRGSVSSDRAHKQTRDARRPGLARLGDSPELRAVRRAATGDADPRRWRMDASRTGCLHPTPAQPDVVRNLCTHRPRRNSANTRWSQQPCRIATVKCSGIAQSTGARPTLSWNALRRVSHRNPGPFTHRHGRTPVHEFAPIPLVNRTTQIRRSQFDQEATTIRR